MSRTKYTKEQIITTLQELAKRLGKDTLTKYDVQTVLALSTVGYRFGSLGNALEVAGLKRRTGHEHLSEVRQTLTDDELFESLYIVEQAAGHEPTAQGYSADGKFSISV